VVAVSTPTGFLFLFYRAVSRSTVGLSFDFKNTILT